MQFLGRLPRLGASLLVLLALSLTMLVFATPARADDSTNWCSQEPFPTSNELRDVSAASESVVWAVGGVGGSVDSVIVRTEDGGSNWEIQTSPVNHQLLGVVAVSPDIAWAVGEQGTILKTTNGGDTWVEQASLTTENLYDVTVSPTDPLTAWAVGGNSSGRMLKTINGGTTWLAQTLPAVDYIWGVSAADSTHVWAVDSSARIIATTDGSSWSTQVDHSADQETLNTVYAVSDTVAFAVGQRWGINKASIYRTINGGTNWVLVDPEPTQYHLRGVAAFDSTHAWTVGDYADMFATTNGTTWSRQTSPNLFSLFAVDCISQTTAWAVGYKGTILKTVDAGNQWNALGINFGYQTSQIDAPDVNTAYVTCTLTAGYAGRVYRTTDAGASWALVRDEPGQPVYGVSSPSANVVWVTGLHSFVLRSIDGGQNWLQRSTGLPDAWFYSISAIDENVAWAVGNFGGGSSLIYKTIDGGLHWTPQNSPVTQSLQCVSAVSDQVAWAVGLSGTLIKTTNGTDWYSQPWSGAGNSSLDLNGVSAVDADTAWAVGYDVTSGSEGVIIKTANGGTTWTEQTSGTGSPIQAVSAFDSDHAFAIGGDLLNTSDGGSTWNIEASPVAFSTGWSGIAAPAAHAAWAAGDFSVLHRHLISSITPASGPEGTLVTIDGSGFGSTRGNSFVMFGSTPQYSGFGSWSDTRITTYIPPGLSGVQQVRVYNKWGRTLPANITVDVLQAPTITTMSPGTGPVGTEVTLTGEDFGLPDDLEEPIVNFGGTQVRASAATSWTRTEVKLSVPVGALGTMGVNVQTAGGTSTPDRGFTVTPAITGLSPTSGPVGTEVTISGTSFGATRGTSFVSFGSVYATDYNWSGNQVICRVPSGASGNVSVALTTPFGTSNVRPFSVTTAGPNITSINPATVAPGDQVTVTGTGFGNLGGARGGMGSTAYVSFEGTRATEYQLWSDTKIQCTVPSGATSGSVTVVNSNGSSNPRNITIVYPTWYLAEGTTAWGFSTYISIQNPASTPVEVTATYMPKGAGNVAENITLPPNSQTTLTSDHLVQKMGGTYDFSTMVEATDKSNTIAVDRTMEWGATGTSGKGSSPEGHTSVGVTSPARTWYLPEGSTNWGFETWLLIQNPGGSEASCDVTYMIEGEGPKTVNHKVPAHSRESYSMLTDAGNADASIKVVSDQSVIPERAMYRYDRREGHDSIGTTTPAADYYLAEGAVGYDSGYTTYVLVQNPQATPTDVAVTYLTGSGAVPGPAFQMPANSRKTVKVNDSLPPATDVSTSVHGSQAIIAERAMYWNSPAGEACHDSIGMSTPALVFYLPDGQTSEGRETWTLVQNPNPASVTVRLTYLPAGGGTSLSFTDEIPANSRKTYNMGDKLPSGRASILVESQDGERLIMCERAMYWSSRSAGTDTIGGSE